MSQTEVKRGIWLGVLLMAVLLVLLLTVKCCVSAGERINYSCKIHKEKPDPGCEACYPLPKTQTGTQPSSEPTVTEARIKESYKHGRLYIQTADVQCVSRGTYKRWGIMTNHETTFLSRMSIERQLIRHEGDTIVMRVRFAENFMVGIFTEVKDVKFELSPNIQTVLNVISASLRLVGQPDLPLKWLPITSEKIIEISNNPLVKKGLSPLLSKAGKKMFNRFGELQGKEFEITWRRGQGITYVKEIGEQSKINAREKQYLYSLSVIPDILMFPDFDKKPREQWKVDARDFVPFLDSSINAKVTGSVMLKREVDEPGETPDSKKAVFSVAGGSFLVDKSYGKQGSKGFTFARWTPNKGECRYDFSKGIFTEGQLTGDIVMQNRGLDLFIFEMEHTEKPRFQIQFMGEVQMLEGGQPE